MIKDFRKERLTSMSQITAPIIDRSWLDRSALQVAPDLVGCTMVRKLPDGQLLRGIIVETEAYEEGDPACHAYRKKTDRNWIMFGPAGYTYVYLIYGMYHCVNVVTDRDEFASAVLIRALDMEDRKSTRLNSSHRNTSRMPSSA